MRCSYLPLTLSVLLLAAASRLIAATMADPGSMAEAEETYELKLLQLLRKSGRQALVNHLALELRERPRPYVKAWYANYLLYGKELGVPEVSDPERGFALACESQKEGSLFGEELVGRAWSDGRGTGERRTDLAVKHLTEAALNGRCTAMSELGRLHFFGQGVGLDRDMAEQWIMKGVWLGATGPLMNLAHWWENPEYVGTANRAKANALYYEAGEYGDDTAMTLLEQRAKQGDRDAQKYVHLDLIVSTMRGYRALPSHLRAAVKWLEANAAADDIRVQIALIDIMKERRLAVYDAKAARAKAERLAAAGNENARALLAEFAWRGIEQKEDPSAAIKIWQELALFENPHALYRMGWMHWWGNGEKHGISQDARKTFEYCRKSAELGYWRAQWVLANLYSDGIGVQKNYFMAAKFYRLLEERRYKGAREKKEWMLAHVKD